MPVNREIYSVNIQMILSIIPFVDLWAAYRIEKLRLWVLLWIGMILIGSILELIVDPVTQSIIGVLIGILIAVFLMRHFTIEWNKKIDESKSQNSYSTKLDK